MTARESVLGDQEFPPNVMSGHRPKGKARPQRAIRAFYGSVAFENAPNLHAGLCGVKSGRTGGSGARCFAASPFGLPGVSSE